MKHFKIFMSFNLPQVKWYMKYITKTLYTSCLMSCRWRFAAGRAKVPTQEKKIPTAFSLPGGPWCPHKKKKKKDLKILVTLEWMKHFRASLVTAKSSISMLGNQDKDKHKLRETKRRRWSWNNYFKKWHLRCALNTSCLWSFKNNHTIHHSHKK